MYDNSDALSFQRGKEGASLRSTSCRTFTVAGMGRRAPTGTGARGEENGHGRKDAWQWPSNLAQDSLFPELLTQGYSEPSPCVSLVGIGQERGKQWSGTSNLLGNVQNLKPDVSFLTWVWELIAGSQSSIAWLQKRKEKREGFRCWGFGFLFFSYWQVLSLHRMPLEYPMCGKQELFQLSCN